MTSFSRSKKWRRGQALSDVLCFFFISSGLELYLCRRVSYGCSCKFTKFLGRDVRMFARFSYHLTGFPNLTGKFELLNIGYKYKQNLFFLKMQLMCRSYRYPSGYRLLTRICRVTRWSKSASKAPFLKAVSVKAVWLIWLKNQKNKDFVYRCELQDFHVIIC